MQSSTPAIRTTANSDSPTVAELIDAMPLDEHEIEITSGAGKYPQALQVLLADLALRPVPTNRLGRLWILGSLQAKVGAAYLAWWMRKWYRNADDRERTLNDAHLKAAFRMLGGMSYLRGAAMKFGQLLANYPEVMPTEFTEVLGSLHFEAPPMHFSLLREFASRELGRDPEEIFDEFEPQAFAAASLGQVHRARLKDSGRLVAVKVQYPNIARTINADRRNLKAICAPMRMLEDWDSLMDGYEDICRMLALECDYQHEAESLRIARQAFSDRTDIVVPKVHDEYSTKRILTMDYLEGKHLREYLATDPSQEDRNRFGELIAHSTFRLSYGALLLHADPHPGNYLFMDDGRLGLLDFGCCVRYSDEDLDYLDMVERAYRTGSEELVRKAMICASRMSRQQAADTERMELVTSWADWVWEPQLADANFNFGDSAYIRRGAGIYSKLMQRRYIRSKPINIWLARTFFGIRAVLTELRANFNYRAIWKEYSDRYFDWD